MLNMQSANGGWGAFDVDNVRQIWNEIPFADMKAMLDAPTADLTGRALEILGEHAPTHRVDGEVVTAAALDVDESLLTGEAWSEVLALQPDADTAGTARDRRVHHRS